MFAQQSYRTVLPNEGLKKILDNFHGHVLLDEAYFEFCGCTGLEFRAFTRGATVGNRNGAVERNELRGDRYVMTGIDKVEPNAWVAVEVDAERFIAFFIDRLAGR